MSASEAPRREAALPASSVIRRGVAADAGMLATLGARTFRETFAAENTAEDMAGYIAHAYGVEQQAAELALPGSVFLIAEVEGKRAAMPTCAGAAPRPPGRGRRHQRRAVEIARFYVDAP